MLRNQSDLLFFQIFLGLESLLITLLNIKPKVCLIVITRDSERARPSEAAATYRRDNWSYTR